MMPASLFRAIRGSGEGSSESSLKMLTSVVMRLLTPCQDNASPVPYATMIFVLLRITKARSWLSPVSKLRVATMVVTQAPAMHISELRPGSRAQLWQVSSSGSPSPALQRSEMWASPSLSIQPMRISAPAMPPASARPKPTQPLVLACKRTVMLPALSSTLHPKLKSGKGVTEKKLTSSASTPGMRSITPSNVRVILGTETQRRHLTSLSPT
mmetsp:Transcript_117956/g.251933  ORF Transcript_117956/g.251933 Transcript_117956/m.251933 type:complete len:212 (-) Transcript_117956:8-643(-)